MLLRFKMVEAALNHTAVEVEAPSTRPSDYFGVKVFGRNVMRKYLDKPTYDALLNTMDNGTPLSLELADSVADKEACCKQLFDECNERLEERGKPVAILAVEDLPLTGMGKIDYRALEKKYANYDYRNWKL